MATAGKGLPFIGKMNEFLDKMLHPTVQKVGNSKAAVDVIHRGYYLLNSGNTYTVEAGSTDNILKITGHGFKPGDLVRLNTTSNAISEFEITIDAITDANNVTLAGYLSASLTAGDTLYVLRPIAERFDSTGATLASVTMPPVSYNRKSGGVTVQTTVLEDKDTPSNSRAMPVVLHGVDAASITITSNDLNIASSAANDSIAIGDGTNLVGVTGTNELKVSLPASQVTTLTPPTSVGLNSGSNLVGKVGIDQTTPGTTNKVSIGTDGTVALNAAIPAGSNLMGKVGIDQTTPGTTNKVSIGTDGTVAINAAIPTGSNVIGKTTIDQTTPGTTNKVYIGTDGTVAINAAIPSGSNLMGKVGIDQTTPGTTNKVSIGTDGTVAINAAIPAGSNVIGKFGIDQTTPGTTNKVSIGTDGLVKSYGTAKTSSFSEITNLTTAAQTFTAPSNAIGALIQCPDTNSVNVRFRQGTATTTSGMQLQPGRSENIFGGSNISVIAESGSNQSVSILWWVEAQS